MSDIKHAVIQASHLAAMTRPGGYHLRIYGRRLGERPKVSSREDDSEDMDVD